MSDPWLWIKWSHMLSATVLLGTGIGTAFHLYCTHLRGDAAAIAAAARNTVIADWLFTAPAALYQPASGLALALMAGIDLLESWLVASYVLYGVAVACWIVVVALQYRIRTMAMTAARTGCRLPSAYFAAMRRWFLLGWPAFVALVGIYVLMVFRPTLW